MNTDKAVTRNDAVAALAELRVAIRLIRSLQRSALPRWSDGMIDWFYDAGTSDDPIVYDDAELESYRLARTHLQNSIRINPNDPTAHALLGNAFAEIDGDAERQLDCYCKSLALDPDDDGIVVARLGWYISNGQLNDALVDLLHLESLDSDHASPMRTHYENAVNGG
ncbi:hypothetical protein [Rhodopirellula baltica]|nr:hypothetical protein [Rhodopirellula baltica]